MFGIADFDMKKALEVILVTLSVSLMPLFIAWVITRDSAFIMVSILNCVIFMLLLVRYINSFHKIDPEKYRCKEE